VASVARPRIVSDDIVAPARAAERVSHKTYSPRPQKKKQSRPRSTAHFRTHTTSLNAELFGGTLPHVLGTMQRHARARGYFSPERFVGRSQITTAHELAMNRTPSREAPTRKSFRRLPTKWPMFGSRARAHRRRRITTRSGPPRCGGLACNHQLTGEPGGKETGQSVTHYIIPGGRYAKAYASFKRRAFNSIGNPLQQAHRRRRRRPVRPNSLPGVRSERMGKARRADTLWRACYEDDGAICPMLAEPGEEA
jgi:hypothetical protein